MTGFESFLPVGAGATGLVLMVVLTSLLVRWLRADRTEYLKNLAAVRAEAAKDVTAARQKLAAEEADHEETQRRLDDVREGRRLAEDRAAVAERERHQAEARAAAAELEVRRLTERIDRLEDEVRELRAQLRGDP